MPQTISHEDLDDALVAFCSAPHWYVAYSGGVDSTALLQLISHWCKVHSTAPPLTAIHINHGIQAQAADWENHCAWICRFLNVPFLPLAADVEVEGRGLEAAAREARYALFEDQLGEGELLFLGHHQDDQVETFFLRLLRGAGLEGLSAMPRQRDLGRGQLFRPLLDFTRPQLETYVQAQGLRCIDDPSNEDITLDRNYLRQEVLPLLAGRWPGYRQTITRASGHLAAASGAREQSVSIPETIYSEFGDPGLPLSMLESCDDREVALVLRGWLKLGHYQAPDQSILDEFLRQLRLAARDAKPQLNTGNYRLQRYQEGIFLLPEAVEVLDEVLPLAPGETLALPGIGRVSLQRCEGKGIWLAADEELLLQWRDGGERCRLAGHKRSKSLKKVLQEAQVPPWWRQCVPLLYLGDELLGLGGVGPCHSSRWGSSGQEAEAPWELVWEPIIASGYD
ncbi:MAG: tRNA lysidine(34) synthetase TilS [Halioglobus sp.]